MFGAFAPLVFLSAGVHEENEMHSTADERPSIHCEACFKEDKVSLLVGLTR